MGVRTMIKRAGAKTSNKIAQLATLSEEQIKGVQDKREKYLLEMPKPDDPAAVTMTQKLLATSSVEIYNAYLRQLKELYLPVEKGCEFETEFETYKNIRYFNITRWVTDKNENSLEKLVNVYQVLSDEDCNIALVFHRSRKNTDVYLAVTSMKNTGSKINANNYAKRIKEALSGNFPGSEFSNEKLDTIPCLNNETSYSVAIASNIPTEKSEKFISQTIEKLLDGCVPKTVSQEYTLILLATPILDIEKRKLHLSEIYSGLAPYAAWTTDFHYTESDSIGSSATAGVNVGVSAGIQNGQNQSTANTQGTSETTSNTTTDGTSSTDTQTQGSTETDTTGSSTSDSTTQTSGTNESSSRAEGTNQSTSSSETVTTSASTTASVNVTNGVNTNVSTGITTGTNTSVSVNKGSSKGIGVVSWSEGVTASVGGHIDQTTTVGVGTSHSVSIGGSETIGTSRGTTTGNTLGTSNTFTESTGKSFSDAVTKGVTENLSKSTAKAISNSVSKAINNSVASTVGKTVSDSISKTAGIFKSTNLGANFGMNFARASNVTATIGKNEGITQSYTNYTVKHALELLEEQMKRFEQSTALGMWDFAAYVLCEDQNMANNVAHSYVALTQGENSYLSQAAINVWRGDMGDEEEESREAREISGYLKQFRHPIFGLNPNKVAEKEEYNIYPLIVTATTALSGKELAYSLNFPKKSVAGLPVIECAEFGRNVISYDETSDQKEKNEELLHIGNIFHMYSQEKNAVALSKQSMASHTFITGSTGSGKSNTVYQILSEARKQDVHFLVVEPAKGEYKDVFGMESDVSVYGTNPQISPMLKINPFSFPKGIHVLEHLDRLVEIFNVCWPMYAAMPAVLKNAVEKSYKDCGWNLLTSKNEMDQPLYPSFQDVADNVKVIIDSSEYDAENKGAYKGSLITRLESLTNGLNGMLFVQKDEIVADELFNKNVIVDLSRVGSAETKSLIMGMIVLKLQEYRMSAAQGINAKLNHITVLEEAHNLLKRTSSEQSAESSNLLGKSVEMLANAIAEMRTYGEGFIIADQAPGLLDMSVIRNTNTKIIMRLPDQSDRELVGHAANLNDDQIKELAKLPCGVAAVYQNEWIQPVLCKVKYYTTKGRRYAYVPQKTKHEEEKIHDLKWVLQQIIKPILRDDLSLKNTSYLEKIVWNSSMKTSVKLKLVKSAKEGPVALRSIVFELLGGVEAIEGITKEQYEIDNRWVGNVINSLREFDRTQYSDAELQNLVLFLFEELERNEPWYKNLHESVEKTYYYKGGLL